MSNPSRQCKKVASSILASLLCLSVALCSCQSVRQTRIPRERIIITVAVPDWELQWGSASEIAAEFERQNEDIDIVLKSSSEILGLPPNVFAFDEDTWRRLATGADVFRVPVSSGLPRQAVRERLVRDLRSFVEAHSTFQDTDFHPGALEAASWDGGIWALPTALDYEVILYDKAAFAAAGLPYPTPGWGWDELRRVATALTTRNGDETLRWGFASDSFARAPGRFVELYAGALLEQGRPAPLFNSQKAVEATHWWLDLIHEAHAMPFPDVPPGDGSGSTLVEQKLAALASYSLQTVAPRLNTKSQELGVVPYPGASPISVEQFCISAGTTHPEAAWRWLDFATRQMPFSMPPQSDYRGVPARRSVAETSKFWDGLTSEVSSALHYALMHPVHSSLADWPTASQRIDSALLTIFRGEKTVEDALAMAQAQAITELHEETARVAAVTPAPVIVTSPDPGPSNATKIAFLTTSDAANLPALHAAAEQFQHEHPDIVVEIKTNVASTTDPAALTSKSDCFQAIPYLDTPEITSLILSVDPFLEADSELNLQDFYPALLKQYRRDGKYWGLPAAAQPYVIEYNPTAFASVGAAIPDRSWSLSDFLTLAQQLTTSHGDRKQYGFAEVQEPFELLAFLEQQGARILDDTQTPPVASFTEPTTVKAVQWYADLRLRHHVTPAFSEDERALVSTGRVGMWVGPVVRNPFENIGTLPFPRGVGNHSLPILQTNGYFISARAKAPQACWAWIRFLSDQFNTTAWLPARRSVATSAAYQQHVGIERAKVYLTAVESGQEVSILARLAGQDVFGPYLVWLQEAYSRIVDEDVLAEVALSDAQKKADLYLACLRTAPPPSSASGYQVCAQQAGLP